MKYIVYLTTNLVNNKIYVGIHLTENLDVFDGYLGCGVNRNKPSTIKHPKHPFQYAIKKYGFDSFRREIISIFNTEKEALDLEGLIVNEEFISRNDTYNIALGGGLPPRNDIKVYQYDLTGKFIKEWESISLAARNFTNSSGSSIWNAIYYKRKSYNFLWSLNKMDVLNINDYNTTIQNVPVHIYDENFKYVKSFNSISESCKYLNICLEQARRSIRMLYKTKGFYLSTDLFDVLPKQENKKLIGLIHQYDLNGNYIQSFKSIKEIENTLHIKIKGLNSYINDTGYYKGFLWRRGEQLEKITPYKGKIIRKVGQFTKEDKLIKIFNTVREARKEFSNVSKVLSGQASHCKGFIFKYID